MLNPDAVARGGLFAALATFLETHADAGIAGAAIENGPGEPEPRPISILRLGGSCRTGLSSACWKAAHRTSPQSPMQARGAATGCQVPAWRSVVRSWTPSGRSTKATFSTSKRWTTACARGASAGRAGSSPPRASSTSRAQRRASASARRRPAYWYDSRRRFFVRRYGVLGSSRPICLGARPNHAGRPARAAPGRPRQLARRAGAAGARPPARRSARRCCAASCALRACACSKRAGPRDRRAGGRARRSSSSAATRVSGWSPVCRRSKARPAGRLRRLRLQRRQRASGAGVLRARRRASIRRGLFRPGGRATRAGPRCALRTRRLASSSSSTAIACC